MTKYIDIHSHLGLLTLEENKEEIIEKMIEKDVATIVAGVDYETSKKVVELATKYDFIWAGVGLHPTDNDKEVFNLEEFKKLAEHDKVVCIGECGLDYFRDSSEETKQKQKELFKKHVELALSVKKPLMIHSRPSKGTQNAYEDVLSILENYKFTFSGSLHFFVGDISIAKRALEIGFCMSFDGPITFTDEYDEVIKFLPIESVMCETDAPFAAPTPYRGKTCEPWMVEEVYKKIAKIKNLSVEEVASMINENVKRVFGI
jgi:TatD DNase family protein